jgi:DNA-binding transcriptional MocR family regulator
MLTVPVRYQISGRGAAAISASVEAGVRSGSLLPGSTLPPVRVLAAELDVAAATVAAAYRDLRQRGVVETAGRNGTRVRARPPVTPRVDRPLALPPGTVNLAGGEPDPGLLPRLGPLLRRLASEIGPPVSYREAGALPELTAQAARRLAADGVPARDGAIAVTAGALDAIERLLVAHLRPGDRVAVEDPGWANLIDLVAALSMEAVPLPVDASGPTVDGLQRTVEAGVAAVVVTSRAQNPTGAAVTAERAVALRRILQAAPGVLVIEDDHAAELATVPLAPLAGAGPAWAFVRSLSKPYGPDLRLAVVAGDEATIARVQGRMRLGTGWVSTVLQRLALLMWSEPAVARLVDKARMTYGQRREALLAALADRGVPAMGRTGINVWIPVDHESVVVAALLERGWAVSPGSLHRQRVGPGIRVTTSALQLSDVDGLADAVAAALAPPGTVRLFR